MAKILVTGATGFIGGRVVDELLEKGGCGVVFTGRSRPKDDSLIRRGAEFLAGDIADKAHTDRVTEGVDAIIHCAGMAGTWGPYEAFHKANVLATRNILASARANGATRFINISSPSIYFDFKDQFDLKETDLPRKFSNHYARTKYEAELLVRDAHARDFATVSLRPRSVVGAGDQNTLPRMIRLQETGNLKQVGHGKNIVDTTTIGNLLDAISLCMTAPSSAMGETYNISNGKPVPFWDFVEMVLKSVGLPVERTRVSYSLAMTLARLNELRCRLLRIEKEPSLLPIAVGIISQSMTMDISKARTRLGYNPRFTLEDGVREFADWWKTQRPR